ncbi:uncharacterized protein LOC106693486 [Microplitis demolitor]|uniref:uncharacterized protein LOC106693486 n=1 Tax=Microplitis demolitor TaxID=69319 RepID=UPI0006D508DB|nr:uncharacterized protein LOC106693486 [Microplitis demolitor]
MSGSETDSDKKIKSESSDEDTIKSQSSGSSFTSLKLNMAITAERAKFDLVILLLETCIAAEVEDTFVNPPVTTPYSYLKAALIKCFAKSEDARITQLLDRERLGDRTSSQHLCHLRSFVPGIDEAIIKARWLTHMRNEIQVCLEAFSDATLDKLAESADRMVEHLSLKPQVVAATAKSSSSTADHGEIAALRREIAQLTNQVKNLQVKRGRSRSRSQSRVPKKFDFCW